jgi:hypothetical protein
VPGESVVWVSASPDSYSVIYAGRYGIGGGFIARVLPDGTNNKAIAALFGEVNQMLVQDDETIFYIESDPDPSSTVTYVRSLPTGGGQPTTLVNDGNTSLAIAADEKYLYVLQEDSNQSPLGLKRVWSEDGSGAIVMVPGVAGSVMAIDNTYVYFATGNEIMRVAK